MQFRLFDEAPSAEFIVTNTGKIITENHKAKELLKKLNKPLSILQSGSFQELFAEEFTKRFQDMISAAMRGVEDEEELFLKPLPSKLDADVLCDLAIGIRFQQTVWKNENCVRITCTDISPFMSRRLFLMQLYRGVYGSLYNFLRSLQRRYEGKETVQRDDMYRYNKISSTLKNTLVLQSYFLGRIELKKDVYVIESEVAAQVGFAAVRAEDLGVTLAVSKETMPLSVTGDSSKHNQLLAVLLDFALEHAVQHSDVSFRCAFVLVTQSVEEGQALASYRVVFRSQKIGREHIDKLFCKKEGSRKTLQEIVAITSEYGVGLAIFDTLLTVMRGYIKEACVEEGYDKRIAIAYEIPLQKATMKERPVSPVRPPIGPRPRRNHVEESKSDTRLFTCVPDETIPKEHVSRRRPSTGLSGEIMKNRFSIDLRPAMIEEDEMSEFPEHTVDDAIKAHVLTTTCRTQSTTLVRVRRSRYSRRNPARQAEFHSPLTTVRRLNFSTGAESATSLLLEQGPLKVLLVEHNNFSRETIKIQLARQTGCEPDLARDGKEALEMFSSYAGQGHMYFIIFMDTVMPKMDGYETTLAIRSLETERGYQRTFICGMHSIAPSDFASAGMDAFSKSHVVLKPPQDSAIVQVFEQAKKAKGS